MAVSRITKWLVACLIEEMELLWMDDPKWGVKSVPRWGWLDAIHFWAIR